MAWYLITQPRDKSIIVTMALTISSSVWYEAVVKCFNLRSRHIFSNSIATNGENHMKVYKFWNTIFEANAGNVLEVGIDLLSFEK